MEIRRITLNDETAFWNLYNEVVSALEDSEFFIPINEETKEHLFDPAWVVTMGAFEHNELVGSFGLFLNEKEYSESVAYMSMKMEAIAKIDRLMVSPRYRGKNISGALFAAVVKEAKKLGKKTLIATVHPGNVYGKTVLQSEGMTFQCAYVNRDGYFRNVYIMSLEEKKKARFKLF